MGIGTSIFLIAVGAILRWGVSDSISGVNLPVIGLILIIVGAIGIVLSFFWMTMWRDRAGGPGYREREVVRDRDPYAP
ncbi:MAG TPA: DUF6458 family protein [Solirubrobacteraceae bacterium]|nr:DUF6458 family protein [Solirubrobacteraceae bacterium]